MKSSRSAPRVPGQVMNLGGKEYVVPRLTMENLHELREEIATMFEVVRTQQMTPGYMDAIISLALKAMRRNYPTIRRAELEDIVDMGNATQLMIAVTGGPGAFPKMQS